MGIFDFLKTKWTAGDMTEEDRKKVFWYLKRTTSYTAWKHQADAFDRFADIFEKQVIEEPIAKAGELSMWDTNWETSYPEILKCQVLYEKALARLKQGDRTIWLYNEPGIMGDAAVIASKWHADIVNHGAGAQGDKYFNGKYVPDMETALKEWFTCAEIAGELESQFEDVSAPDYFFPGKFDPQSGQYNPPLPFPAVLPEVPQPKEEVLVRTGEPAPVFGIYEPQVKDGCMNYLLGGVAAPTYVMGSYEDIRSVTWRLIWEDTRYLDGHVSSEEDQYFPAQATAKPAETYAASDLLSANSGQTCPKAGNWAVMNDLQGKVTLNKGDKMPQHLGGDVTWVWSQ